MRAFQLKGMQMFDQGHQSVIQAKHQGSQAEPIGRTASRFFDRWASRVTAWAGSPSAFGTALVAVLVWAVCGPAFDFSETWQLIINTGTTIVTFLMVFLIQQTQNKDGRALHLKLDELLISLKDADESLVDAEQLDEDELRALAAACTDRARRHILQKEATADGATNAAKKKLRIRPRRPQCRSVWREFKQRRTKAHAAAVSPGGHGRS